MQDKLCPKCAGTLVRTYTIWETHHGSKYYNSVQCTCCASVFHNEFICGYYLGLKEGTKKGVRVPCQGK